MKILEEKFRFQFEGSESERIDNYTNQSPFPISHILREVEVAGAVVKLGGDEMCARKISDIPPITEESIDHCIFASIWNSDIEVDLIDTLDEQIVECGCIFVVT